MTNKNFALIGNPNCGKTTLFNTLTGSKQKVGNWTGVTTEKKQGIYLGDKSVKIIDLPGLYSLDVRSQDEKAVIDYLEKTPPDVIINVVDGTNLERNLYLTIELLKLNIPIILAVSFYDQLEKNNMRLNIDFLSQSLGVKIIPVYALSGKNIDKMVAMARASKKNIEKSKIKKLISPNEIYKYIENLLDNTLVKKCTKAQLFTEKADKILLNKWLGFPILITVVTFIYYLSISVGGVLGERLSNTFESVSLIVENKLNTISIPEWIVSLLCNAIIKGIGVVLGFFPQILILFALLAIVEESGYASRMTFIVDRLFSSFGLGGKSFIPMILGCGCTVTGLMATRTIESEGAKRMTVFLTPFMPCGAKTAVFGWFASVIFGGNPFFATAMYFLSIFCVVIGGKILHNFKSFSFGEGSFIMEIPTLRPPRLKDVFAVLSEKIKDYLTKAGLIIFIVSVILWALENVGISGYVGNNVDKSFLFFIGEKLKFIFYPIGCSDWRTSVALISGIFAKEAVIETLELLSNSPSSLFFNDFSAYAFCAFILLSPPCVASIVQAKQELKSSKWLVLMIIFQTLIGYGVASLINFVGFIVDSGNRLILSIIIGIIILISVIFAVKKYIKLSACKNCLNCKRRIKCQPREKPYTI